MKKTLSCWLGLRAILALWLASCVSPALSRTESPTRLLPTFVPVTLPASSSPVLPIATSQATPALQPTPSLTALPPTLAFATPTVAFVPTSTFIQTTLPTLALTTTSLAPQLIRFTAQPDPVKAGEAVLIQWEVQGAEQVSLRVVNPDIRFGPWFNDLPAQGELMYKIPANFSSGEMTFLLVPLPEGDILWEIHMALAPGP